MDAEVDAARSEVESRLFPIPTPIPPNGLASRVEQLARRVHSLCWADGMQAAQWSALRYFAMAEPRACTIVGLARFQGTNPGTASRTAAVLTKRGLLTTTTPPEDRRLRLLSLTSAGRALLDGDPLLRIGRAIAAMPHDQRMALDQGVSSLLDHLIERAGRPASP